MKSSTSLTIIESAVSLLARSGYAGTSMRDVANAADVKTSVIYHYFPDKAELFRRARQHINILLDTKMNSLPAVDDAPAFLRQRLEFQLVHMEYIVALLQYFMAVKADFPAEGGGYVPQRAYRHMREVIERGIAEGVYTSDDIDMDAKILTHLINGFLLEYYPHPLERKDKDMLVEQLANFIERSLKVEVKL
jgi:AcrR family transcriptional regulator